jgi:acyl-CoA synthetase (AMP-forming)/AMP-acid ligase II/acyl carrier protein
MTTSDLEARVTAICGDVLKRSDLSLDDDLIEFGMDSLEAVEIVTRLQLAFNVDVIDVIFHTPTVRQLCSFIGGAPDGEIRQAPDTAAAGRPLPAAANILHAVASAAEKFGSAEYLLPVEPWERPATFTDVLAFTRGCASLLDERGASAGARVAVIMHNSSLAVLLFLGITSAQRTVVFLNPKAAPAELEAILDHARPALVLADEVSMSRISRRYPWMSTSDQESLHASILERGHGYQGELPAADGSGARDAEIVYTSGSTGVPKGVVLSHRALLAGASSLARWASAGPDDVFFNVNPMSHAGAHVFPTLTPLMTGGRTLCIRPDAGLAHFWSYVDRYEPTWTLVVNAFLAHLAGRPERPDAKGLKGVLAGGSPLSEKLIHRFEETFGLPVYQVYGMTEMSTITNVESRDRKVGGPRNAGAPIDCAQVRIVDAQGQDLPPGANGEILLRGTNQFTGYLDDPRLTEQRLKDGWIHTGDLGNLNDRGELSIVDRIDSMVIVSGENIYPAEIEGAVPHLKGIEDAVLVTLPHPVTGVELILVYKLIPGAVATVDEWRVELLKHVSRFKVPRRFVPLSDLFVDTFPRTPLGKIIRPEVQRLAVENLSPA